MTEETKETTAAERTASSFGWLACGLFLTSASQYLPDDLASMEARAVCLFFGVVILALSIGFFAEGLVRVVLGVDKR